MRRLFAHALNGASVCFVACVLLLAACGGGGGGSTQTPTPTPQPADNVQAVTVDSGPTDPSITNAIVDTLFTSVTVCLPGSTTCQTIDHIQVDTGSSGLRILSSVLTLKLPLQTDSSGNAIVECTQFIDGFSWGPVRTADIKISGEVASAQGVQVIGDSAYPTVPSACSSTGTAENTVGTFGANGILGVGPFISDCGSGCATTPNPIYYTCSNGSTCTNAAVTVAAQVSNPVAAFATDNNGIIIELPSISESGATSVDGSLIFGIGTQSNNALGSATVLPVSTSNGSLSTTYKGKTLTDSFIDSGSNALYFPDTSIATCASSSNAPGFYCPGTTLSLSATIIGTNNASSQVSFMVADANSLFNTTPAITAADDLGSPSVSNSSFDGTNSFDWGLPFYFGRNVYTAIETRNTSAGMGPYFAF